ncbi:hypothetical protein ACX80V_12410 [Arthrobacter sp. MDT3-24]
MDEFEHQIRGVSHYVALESAEDVVHAERLLSTKVLGEIHEVWDVRTTSDRFWVVTNPMHLYAQDEFRSANEAVTYHVGLTARVASRGGSKVDIEESSQVSVAWRKFRQAEVAYNAADEAEAFQAVGVRCREALLALAASVAAVVPPEAVTEAPQQSNFKGWAGIASEHIASGRLRAYLKSAADRTWDLAVWLQHYADATPWDAELVLDATEHTITTFAMAIRRHRMGQPERCSRCGSYRVEEDSGVISKEPFSMWHERVCGACEFRWGRSVTSA